MNEKEARTILEREGFKEIYIWTDKPEEHYFPHKHNSYSAHIIIKGSMTIKTEEILKILKPGDRFDIKQMETHEVIIGKYGCTYAIANK